MQRGGGGGGGDGDKLAFLSQCFLFLHIQVDGWSSALSALFSVCPCVLFKQVIIKAITAVLGKQAPLTHSGVI